MMIPVALDVTKLTHSNTPWVEEFQKKATDSEKIGRNWRSFEAKQKPTRQ
jgi:hypothetical protein